MDRLAAHPTQPVLENVRVEFFPPNCTSVLQPLDFGHYCKLQSELQEKTSSTFNSTDRCRK